MRLHTRLHGVDVRRQLQELFGATRRQILGFDEPLDDLLTSVELLDEAIEQLYGGWSRVGRATGGGPSHRPDRGSRIPGSWLSWTGRLTPGGPLGGPSGTGPGSGGCPGSAE
jgi:hypothetical protein